MKTNIVQFICIYSFSSVGIRYLNSANLNHMIVKYFSNYYSLNNLINFNTHNNVTNNNATKAILCGKVD